MQPDEATIEHLSASETESLDALRAAGVIVQDPVLRDGVWSVSGSRGPGDTHRAVGATREEALSRLAREARGGR